jgi:FkbM family methyltransferase
MIGDHTRQYLDAGMKVFAFEPNPDAFECLQANCPDAELWQLATSDCYGHLAYARDGNAGASHIREGGDVFVGAAPLDGMREGDEIDAPDFIKIDVEGFELKALKGMEQTLRSFKPKLFVEFNRGALERNQSSPEALKVQIESYGYTNFEIYPPNAKPTDEQYDYFIS